MTQAQGLKLQHFFDAGYAIKIEAGPYETGFVTDMGLRDYEQDEDHEENPRVFTDEFQSDSSLNEIDISQVQVFRKVDFENDEPEELDDDHQYNQ